MRASNQTAMRKAKAGEVGEVRRLCPEMGKGKQQPRPGRVVKQECLLGSAENAKHLIRAKKGLCLAYLRAHKAQRRREKRREDGIETGCVEDGCDREIVPGQARCAECLKSEADLREMQRGGETWS